MATTLRRRLLRTSRHVEPDHGPTKRRIATTLAQLAQERASLARWTKRLKRSFHSVERIQAKIVRLERRIAGLSQ